MLLGFSTGAFLKFIQPASKKAIQLCRDLDCNAISLCIGDDLDSINFLKNIKKDDVKDFQFVSIHSPGHDTMMAIDIKEQKRILDDFQKIYEKLNFDYLVLHPGEWITDWEIFSNYTFPIAFENMDWRHKIGADVESMKEILEKKNFKMVLDLNHCYTHDKTMKLAKELYENFKDKIVHYHISGIEDDGENCHVPLYRSQKEIILNAISDLNLPIIIESACDNIEEAKKEMEYIREQLNNL